jgi:hypothetical protein
MLVPLRAKLAWAAWKYPRFQRLVAPACGKGKRGRSPACGDICRATEMKIPGPGADLSWQVRQHARRDAVREDVRVHGARPRNPDRARSEMAQDFLTKLDENLKKAMG